MSKLCKRYLVAVCTRCWWMLIVMANSIQAKPMSHAEKSEAWDPNYCNDTKLQESAALTKTALGQFLGYQCDTIFFHCRWGVDGWKTYKKACKKGLVYDTFGTQNCNYDFNVEGCGMKQCADCLGDQYACCLSEECVDLGMRCDGKYDCTLEEDEQNCPTCGAGQFPCVLSEQCISFDKRCNGAKECQDGTDELHCEECQANMFYCRNSKMCVEQKLRCDGKRDCNFGEDEAFCDVEDHKEYTCEDQEHTVPKQDVCNGVADCPDGSDEFYCIGSSDDEETSSSSAKQGVKVVSNSNSTLAPKEVDYTEEIETVTSDERPTQKLLEPLPVLTTRPVETRPTIITKSIYTLPITFSTTPPTVKTQRITHPPLKTSSSSAGTTDENEYFYEDSSDPPT